MSIRGPFNDNRWSGCLPPSQGYLKVGIGTVSLSLKTVQADMNSSFDTVLVGRPASSRISGQQMQEGLCALRCLQAAGQPCPGLETSKPAIQPKFR